VSRRAVILWLSGALALGLTVATFTVPIPYVLLQGGPVYDTLGTQDGRPVITIDGRESFPTDGELDLTTVSLTRRVTMGEAILGWFDRDTAVSPKEFYVPPGKSIDQVKAEDRAAMVASQSSAKTAALGRLGIPVTVSVQAVSDAGPAQGKLRAGDVLDAVDGAPVTSPTVLVGLIGAKPVGSTLSVAYTRDGAAATVDITTVDGAAAGDPPRPVVGITPVVTDFPFDISISLEAVGGPSAGLMFALGIIDKLEPGSLTAGRHIAGTGEITDQGQVMPIGGIQQKLSAARKDGAVVFLVPADNCVDAEANRPAGLQLVKVTTLDSAVQALGTLAGGGTPPGCSS
jgi:PDZ domain-containing protein